MNIQGLQTRKDKEEYLMNIFQILVKELPEEGMQFVETDDYMSLRVAGKSSDYLRALA